MIKQNLTDTQGRNPMIELAVGSAVKLTRSELQL